MKALLCLLFLSTSCFASPRKTDHLFLNGEIDEGTTKELVANIAASDADRIILEINSPGGSVGEGFIIAKAIELSHAKFTCVVDDVAASMAFYVLQSCAVRVMTKRAMLMAHEPAMSATVPFAQPTTWHNMAIRISILSRAMSEWCGHRLVGGAREYRRQTANGKEWWLDWHEALRAGAVDRVVTLPSDLG